MALRILTAPNPRLKAPADSVKRVDETLLALIEEMKTLMYQDEGVGLAAPQVGISKKIILIDIKEEDGSGSGLKVFLNPEIRETSEEKVLLPEACLSLPGVSADLVRPKKVVVEYHDLTFNLCRLEADNWLARCLLHEMDHLQGKLYIDHLPPLKRKMLLNRSIRYRRQAEKN